MWTQDRGHATPIAGVEGGRRVTCARPFSAGDRVRLSWTYCVQHGRVSETHRAWVHLTNDTGDSVIDSLVVKGFIRLTSTTDTFNPRTACL